MTIVIGLIDNGIIYMGSDRGMSDEYSISSPITPKIKKNGQFLIGYASSRGAGQVAHYVDFPNVLKKDLDKYMRTDFIFTLKKAIEPFGLDISDDDKAKAKEKIKDKVTTAKDKVTTAKIIESRWMVADI